MKRLNIFIVIIVFAMASTLLAVDKVNDSTRQVPKPAENSDSGKYQNFIDQNNNGVDDKLEQKRKETTKVEPKRDSDEKAVQPVQSEQAKPVEKYKPESTKVKEKEKSDPQKETATAVKPETKKTEPKSR